MEEQAMLLIAMIHTNVWVWMLNGIELLVGTLDQTFALHQILLCGVYNGAPKPNPLPHTPHQTTYQVLFRFKLCSNVFSLGLGWGKCASFLPGDNIGTQPQNLRQHHTHRFVKVLSLVAPVEKLLEASSVQCLDTSCVYYWVYHGDATK